MVYTGMEDKTPKTLVKEEDVAAELADDFEGLNVEMLLPSMNVNKEIVPEEKECIVKDEELTGLYDEILEQCREDRKQFDDVIANFLDMVMNDGDASSASKEAIVNLLKSKSDISDKMAKVADLKTRIKLKDKDTFPRYLAQQQNNKVVIEGSKRDLLKSVNKLVNKKGKTSD
jgi:hypothetical protein